MRGEAREKILWAAVKLFAEKGFEQTTFNEIAREAKVGASTPFTIFGSKDQILTTILQYKWGLMNKYIFAEVIQKTKNPKKRILLAFFACVLLLRELLPELGLLWLVEGRKSGKLKKKIMSSERIRVAQYIEQILIEGQKDGFFYNLPKSTVSAFRDALVGMYEQWLLSWIWARDTDYPTNYKLEDAFRVMQRVFDGFSVEKTPLAYDIKPEKFRQKAYEMFFPSGISGLTLENPSDHILLLSFSDKLFHEHLVSALAAGLSDKALREFNIFILSDEIGESRKQLEQKFNGKTQLERVKIYEGASFRREFKGIEKGDVKCFKSIYNEIPSMRYDSLRVVSEISSEILKLSQTPEKFLSYEKNLKNCFRETFPEPIFTLDRDPSRLPMIMFCVYKINDLIKNSSLNQEWGKVISKLVRWHDKTVVVTEEGKALVGSQADKYLLDEKRVDISLEI